MYCINYFFQTIIIILIGRCILTGCELHTEGNSDILASCALEATRTYFQSEGTIILATQDCETDQFPFLNDSGFMIVDEFNISTSIQDECVINTTIYLLDVDRHMKTYQNWLKQFTAYEVKSCRFNFTDLETTMLQELHNTKKWRVLIFPYNRTFEYPGRGDISGYIITAGMSEYYEMEYRIHRILTVLLEYRMLKYSTFFLVLVSGEIGGFNVERVITLFMEFHVLDVIILVYDESNEVVNFYTFNPYELPSGKCGLIYKGILISKCYFDESGVVRLRHRTTDFEIIPNLEGCSVFLNDILSEPLTIESDVGDRDIISNQSVVFILFKYVLDVMKMSLHTNRVQIQKNERFLMLDLQDIQGTKGELFVRYYTTTYYWFLYKSDAFARWSTIFCVFSNYVWLCILLTIFFTASYLQYISRNIKYNPPWWLNLLSIQLGIAIREPKALYLRFILLAWLMYSLPINTIFQCFFTSYLSDPVHEHQIDTYEEIVEQNYELILTDGNSVFLESGINITSNKKWITNREGSLLYLHNGSRRAVSIPQESVTYFYNKLCDGNIRNKLHRITTYQNQHHLTVEFTNKHFEKRFYVLLNRLIESGFPDKLCNVILYPKGMFLASTKLSELVGYFYPFSIIHMKSAFLFYFIGLGASLLIFLIEVIVHSLPLLYRGSIAASIPVRNNFPK
ncbi:hypothetical protein L9F63_011707 [Diploptera punctata]|uniref:Uncharacterized protein n=1 Tax=Diploptera punctata TaxID=6984 RepID=A0AAD8AF28_DIPPU|nr:hypothetical protein L9F63_011707 [Diploptera punctata]